MDKRQLQAYAVWAKENLETQIEVSLKTLGIFSDTDIKNAKIIGDVVVRGRRSLVPEGFVFKEK